MADFNRFPCRIKAERYDAITGDVVESYEVMGAEVENFVHAISECCSAAREWQDVACISDERVRLMGGFCIDDLTALSTVFVADSGENVEWVMLMYILLKMRKIACSSVTAFIMYMEREVCGHQLMSRSTRMRISSGNYWADHVLDTYTIEGYVKYHGVKRQELLSNKDKALWNAFVDHMVQVRALLTK